VLHTGLRQCGTIGLVAALLYVGLSVFGLGYDGTWTYEAVGNGGVGPHYTTKMNGVDLRR